MRKFLILSVAIFAFASQNVCDTQSARDILAFMQRLSMQEEPSGQEAAFKGEAKFKNAECIDDGLVYFFELKDFDDLKYDDFSSKQIDVFLAVQTNTIKQKFCNNAGLLELASFFPKGLAWDYSTESKKHFGKIELTPKICKE